MTDRMAQYIARSTTDRAVQSDLKQLHANTQSRTGLLTPEMIQNARVRGHSAELSRALQRIETMAGNDNNFGVQRRTDQAQQLYDMGAAQVNGNHVSGDTDGFQDYLRQPEVGAAERASKHNPADALNARTASRYIKDARNHAVDRGAPAAGARADNISEAYDRKHGIDATGSAPDNSGLNPLVRHLENASTLERWLFMKAYAGR